jgi:hypothetical protein
MGLEKRARRFYVACVYPTLWPYVTNVRNRSLGTVCFPSGFHKTLINDSEIELQLPRHFVENRSPRLNKAKSNLMPIILIRCQSYPMPILSDANPANLPFVKVAFSHFQDK